jgi:hypothetical protein
MQLKHFLIYTINILSEWLDYLNMVSDGYIPSNIYISHMLHVWNIYQHLPQKSPKCS